MIQLNKNIKYFLFFSFILLFSFSANSADSMKENYVEFKKDTEFALNKIEKKLELLGDKIEYQTGNAKKYFAKEYKELSQLKNELKVDIANASDYTSEKWQTAKARIEDLVKKLESKIDKTLH